MRKTTLEIKKKFSVRNNQVQIFRRVKLGIL